ncbi:MAG: PVC-type heme-binding CxxCH protein [Limisphaerales bacterium]
MFASDLPRVSFRMLLSLCVVSTGLSAAEIGTKAPYQPKIAEASEEGELAIKKFKVPEGFKIELFAAEPRLANPVSFTIDEKGRFYVAETFRHTDGTLDVRKYMHWLDEELANQTIEEQREKILQRLHESPDMFRETERVRLIEDRNRDGKADFDSVFAEGFNSELHGIGAGLLARKGNVYFTCIPSLYLLRDENGDGKADVKKALQTGYGVRFAYIGHDLHGLKMGPDGKLYFSIGDRGFNVKQGDRTIAFPEGGAVLRCNLDGSDLEIFSYGLRNPQELAFDQYGNLWTGDNNSDGGDQVRWTYVVEGGDVGWRIGYQYISQPNNRGPWVSERMWEPQNPDQPAYIVPPIANFANGPSGLAFYPGVGLPAEYDNHFFLCDFKGTSARSLIHTFAVRPKGASFELVNRRDFMNDILCTDVEFGPDSNIYVSDWTEGWNKPGKGRIYRVYNPDTAKDPVVAEVQRMIGEGFEKRSVKELTRLLAHRDMRIRQEAQFELAERGNKSVKPLVEVVEKSTNQLARIHAIWALGQVATAPKQTAGGKNSALLPLIRFTSDKDPEIRAQVAKVLGDARFGKAGFALVRMLQHGDKPRGQYHAALALGKIGDKSALSPILQLVRANNDQDAYLRHAGVMALLWLKDYQVIQVAAKDESPAVRMIALLAMRRLQHPDIAVFLDDSDPRLVVEAARAINDLPIVQALPDLAKLIDRAPGDEALFRRVLNANYRVGEPQNAAALTAFALKTDAPEALRSEALELLATWAKPSNRDRITGLWRPLAERDASAVVNAVRPRLSDLLENAPNPVRLAAVQFSEKYQINEVAPLLFELVAKNDLEAKIRVAALQALASSGDSRLGAALEIASSARQERLRKEAVSIQARLKPADATAPLLAILKNGSAGEKQNALASLGTLQDDAADKIISDWLDQLIAGSVPSELQLDLIEAAGKRQSDLVKQKLAQFEAARPQDRISKFRETMHGGNAEEGRKIFFERVDASCVRCHRVGGEGGEAGPALDGIASRVSREYLLASLVDPNRDIAPGFESVNLFLKNGTVHSGTLQQETSEELILNSPEDGTLRIKVADVARRERGVSGMPAELAEVLSKQDVRNLVEFLATQK